MRRFRSLIHLTEKKNSFNYIPTLANKEHTYFVVKQGDHSNETESYKLL